MRKTKEAIHIRLQGAAMNRDQGAFISGIYDPLTINLRKFTRFSASVTPEMSTVVDETVSEKIRLACCE